MILPSVPDSARQLHRPTVSSAHALYMLMLAEERGIGEQTVLAESGVTRAHLAAPNARITPWQQALIIFNLQSATDDPSLAMEFALRSNLTKAGLIGFGLMSCATLGEAIELGTRYLPTQVPFFSARTTRFPEAVEVEMAPAFPLGRLEHFAIESVVVEAAVLYDFLLYPGESSHVRVHAELHFTWPEPEYFARYREQLPHCRFNAPTNCIRVAAELLNAPIRTANPKTAQLIVQQCEAELAELGYTESMVERVRNLLICGEHGYPSLAEIAGSLHCSERTLKRKLSDGGASYSELLDQIRQRDAQRLLDGTALSIEEIAARVGYTDRANFSRAYKRWTGVAPGSKR